MCTWRNRLWYLGIQGISLLGLSVYIYTHTERQAVVSGYLGYQSADLSIHIYTHIQYTETSCGIWLSRVSACCPLHIYLHTHTEEQVVVSGYLGYQHAVFSVYIYTHIQRNRLWYLGIRGISLLSSLYISIHTYRETGCGIWVSRVSACWVFLCIYIHAHRETGCGIWVSRVSACCPLTYISINAYRETGCGILVSKVSVCWVFLYTSIHTYRETSSGIRVSRVSVCCPLHIYLYTHTEKQVVVSGYLGYQPAVLSVCLYTHTEKQVMVSGYPGYQSAVLSIYIYRHIQRDKRWYLGIQCIS